MTGPDTRGTSERRGGQPTLRSRKKARTREAIAEAALRLFAEQGYDETTVEDVAAAADVSPATVFRYFGSKEDLVFSEARSVPLLGPAIAERPGDESDLEAVAAGLAEVLRGGEFGVERVRLLRRALAESTVLRGRGTTMVQIYRRGIAEGLAKRHGRSPSDPSIVLRAALCMAAFEIAMDEWVTEGQGDAAEVVARQFERLGPILRDLAEPQPTDRGRHPSTRPRGQASS